MDRGNYIILYKLLAIGTHASIYIHMFKCYIIFTAGASVNFSINFVKHLAACLMKCGKQIEIR